jgi:hypothetical protein
MTSTAVRVGFVEDGDFRVEILPSEVIVTDNSVGDNDSNVLGIDSGVIVTVLDAVLVVDAGVVVVVVVGVVVVVDAVVVEVDADDEVEVEMDGFLVLLVGMILCVPLLDAGRLVVPFLLTASVRI